MDEDRHFNLAMFYAQMVFGCLAFWGLIVFAIVERNVPAFGAAIAGCGSVVISQSLGMARAPRIAFIVWCVSLGLAIVSLVLLKG